jgi:hypothetical protein
VSGEQFTITRLSSKVDMLFSFSFVVCSFLVVLTNATPFDEFPPLQMSDKELEFAEGARG